MPYYDVIIYSHGTWVISQRTKAPTSEDVHKADFTTWTEVEADDPKDAMEQGYNRIKGAKK